MKNYVQNHLRQLEHKRLLLHVFPVLHIGMVDVYGCHYIRASIRQLSQQATRSGGWELKRNEKLRSLFPHVTFPSDKRLSAQCKRLNVAMARKWPQRLEYLDRFGVKKVVRLSKQQRLQHTAGKCSGCLGNIAWDMDFPTKSMKGSGVKNLRTAKKSHGGTEIAKVQEAPCSTQHGVTPAAGSPNSPPSVSSEHRDLTETLTAAADKATERQQAC